MRRPLLFILGVWMVGELVVHGAGLNRVPPSGLDQAMAGREDAIVRVLGTVREIRRTSSGYAYTLSKSSVFFGDGWKREGEIDSCGQTDSGGNTDSCGQTGSGGQGNPCKVSSLLVYTESAEDLRIGYQLAVTGTLSPFERPGNPGQFDTKAYYHALGMDYRLRESARRLEKDQENWLSQSLYILRERLTDRMEDLLTEEEESVLPAMLLGSRSLLDPGVRKEYQGAGLSHLLAISGLHISLAGMAIYRILRRIGLPLPVGAGVSAFLAICYVILTGGGPSARRALIMYILYLVAQLTGRTYDLLSALSLAGLCLLIDHPLLLWQSSFQLSLLAVTGVGVVQPVLIRMLPKGKPRKRSARRGASGKLYLAAAGIPRSLLASLSIFWMTAPVVAWMNGVIPVYSVFLNLLVLPFAGAALMSSGAAAMLAELACRMEMVCQADMAVILNVSAKLALLPGRAICHWIDAVCRTAQKLPGHAWVTGRPALWQILCYYGVLAGSLWCLQQVRKNAGRQDGRSKSVIPCILLLLLPLLLHPPGFTGMQLTILDVGQGDSIFLRTSAGCCLVDAGSSSVQEVGEYRILPFLKNQGIDHLDALILTHADSDHWSGMSAILQDDAVSVGALGLSPAAISDPEIADLIRLAGEKQIPVLVLQAGSHWTWGETKMTCVYPESEDCTQFADNKNETSLVFHLENHDFSALLTGDLGEEGEAAWMKREIPPDITLLKVGHHGSRFASSTPFLDALTPEIAVISCGKKNLYGHPHEETLERLHNCGSPVLTTPQAGAITVRTHHNHWKIYHFIKEKI